MHIGAFQHLHEAIYDDVHIRWKKPRRIIASGSLHGVHTVAGARALFKG